MINGWMPVTSENGAVTAVLDDTIFIKGYPARAGSAMLEGFIAPFDAAVTEKLRAADYRITGITAAQPFALGELEKSAADSTANAIEVLQNGDCDIALSNDVSGKLRRQSAGADLWYLHPGYGTVSRYGLIPTVSSMDQIGVLAQSFTDCFRVLEAISGHDERDGTSLPQEAYRYAESDVPVFAIPQEPWAAAAQSQKVRMEAALEGQTTQSCSISVYDVLAAVQCILTCAEFSNNANRYDGVKYGHRAADVRGVNELYLRSRTEGFELNAKLHAILGAYVLSQGQYERYYEKAMRVRALLKHTLPLQQGTVLVLPCALPGDDPFVQSALYAIATLCGLPSLSCPLGGGLQLVAAAGDENTLFSAAKLLTAENGGLQ